MKLLLVLRSIAASLMISLGVAVLLAVGNPIGPFLFALGLLGICMMKLNLFTGKCGYLFLDRIPPLDLLVILITNLISGFLFGLLLSLADTSYYEKAVEKVATWSFDLSFFIKALFCGVIMFVCVEIYRRGSPLGILLGIPLFIFCGFQHCIANIIVLGMAHTMDASILLCIVGNFVGSLLASYLIQPGKKLQGGGNNT